MTATEPKRHPHSTVHSELALLTAGIASILLMGWSHASWPHCTNWDEKKFFCSDVMTIGFATAMFASLVGIVWTACSQYPRWGYAAVTCVLFLIGLVFGTMPRF